MEKNPNHNNKEPDMARECVQKSDGRPETRLPHVMYSSEGNGEVTSEQEEKLLCSIRWSEFPFHTFLGFASLLCVALADEP